MIIFLKYSIYGTVHTYTQNVTQYSSFGEVPKILISCILKHLNVIPVGSKHVLTIAQDIPKPNKCSSQFFTINGLFIDKNLDTTDGSS